MGNGERASEEQWDELEAAARNATFASASSGRAGCPRVRRPRRSPGCASRPPGRAPALDLCERRLLACPMSDHPDAERACDAIMMAATVRGGKNAINGVIFHTDRGSTHPASDFTALCRRLAIRQSMRSVGSCVDRQRGLLLHTGATRGSRGATSPPRPRLVPSSRHGATIPTAASGARAGRLSSRRLSTRVGIGDLRVVSRPHRTDARFPGCRCRRIPSSPLNPPASTMRAVRGRGLNPAATPPRRALLRGAPAAAAYRPRTRPISG